MAAMCCMLAIGVPWHAQARSGEFVVVGHVHRQLFEPFEDRFDFRIGVGNGSTRVSDVGYPLPTEASVTLTVFI